jgi:YegS/Rv2252/BmrU family lipid kinase
MGVIPLGTGNDFARGIGLPRGRDLDACVDTIVNGVPRAVDMGRYRTETAEGCFLNVASTGFDAAVTRAALRLKKRIKTPLIYLLAIPAALPDLRFPRVTIDVDGTPWRRRVLMVAVANGARYGGGIRINPAGAPDDGFLDLVIYRAASPVKVVATLPRFLRGRHRRLDQVETIRCRSVRIDGDRPLPVNIDGEVRGTTPLAVEIMPRGLTLLVPSPGGDGRGLMT